MTLSKTYQRPWTGWQVRVWVLALLLLGAALRLGAVGAVPPGLYQDEAQNGLDALRVLQGEWPVYFAANNGREPGFIYLVAAAVAVLGRTPFAIRLPSFFIGTLTLAATYDLARILFSIPGQSQADARRMGRLALATLAVTFWHVHLSRVGFRVVLLPLFTALYLGQAVRALRSQRHRYWIAAGALYGASWYTYMAARFTPVAIAALAIYGLYFHWRRRSAASSLQPDVQARLKLVRGIALALAGAFVVLLPLGFYTLTHPEVVLARSGQVSILSDSIHQGRFWQTLGQHTLRTAGMFTVRGDRIWRHNLAWRPVWDPALGLAFTLGLGVCLAGILGSRPELVLIVIWTGAMALPTLLAEDAPHFLRAAGVLPTAALIPAVGLAWLSSTVYRITGRHRLAALLPWLLLSLGLVSTTYDYFVRYPAAPSTYTWFESGAVDLADQLNALRLAEDRAASVAGRGAPAALFIDRQLWEEWPALPFMLAGNADHRPIKFLPDDSGSWPDDSGRSASSVIYAVWPYRDWEPDVLPNLPRPSYLQLFRGPHAQGDRDPAPFTTALIIAATTRPAVPEPVGYFEGGVLLRAALVKENDSVSEVWLWWETSEPLDDDYTVFVHYLRDGNRIAQHDGQPGLGHLRTSFWQPGDLILDIHTLDDIAPASAHDTIRLGLYDATTGRGLIVVDGAGNPLDVLDETALNLPVITVKD